ncbi:hypothetical protein [Streptosporangium canum]|uniref:hypothetical protein n=1 Tax=Streptosporangium canum TaxID=324952 RepID=UPI0037AF3B79
MSGLPFRESALHHHLASRRRVERLRTVSGTVLLGLWVYVGLLALSMTGVVLIGILPVLGPAR